MAGALATALMTTVQAKAQGAPAQDPRDQALAYAQCVRENGYPEFPDPDAEGGFQFLLDRRSTPGFMAAQEACRDLAPGSLAPDGADPDRMERLVTFAQCMRDGGVADFPDPDPQGGFDFRGLNIGSPTARAAMDACTQAAGVTVQIGG